MTRTARGSRPQGVSTEPERTDDISPSQQDEGRHGFRYEFLRNRSVRARVAGLVFIPLLGALIFGSYVFYGALRDYSAASEVERNTEATRAVLAVVDRVQDERDVAVLERAGATGDGAVASARDRTDQAMMALESQLDELIANDSSIDEAVRAAQAELAAHHEHRAMGTDTFRAMIRSLLSFVKATSAGVSDPELVDQIDVLDSLARTTESASLERGLAAHLIALGEPVGSARERFVSVSRTEQDLLIQPFASVAESEDWIAYTESRKMMDELRRELVNPSGELPFTPNEWYDASTDRIDVLRGIQANVNDSIAERASDAASSARWTAVVTALIVLMVLVLTILSAFAVARSIVRPLRRLRSAALEAADIGLPALVSRIQEDGPAVVRRIGDAVTPEGADEIGQVASAFNEVHATAVRVAGEQALLRQNLDTIVVNLSRRTQSLVDRQLGEIEDLESRERDPDQLGTLFRIDHLATRVRRHAESLLVLAGVEEMRRQGVAAPVLDVVRTAVGEVEQYPRIKFGVMPTDLVVPSAVDDVAHLLAELLDNATEFSAPSTPVTVTSQPLLGGGLRLQVTDQGLGIPADQLATLNERFREPGDIDVAASRTLGIYVVARLAARHGITVRLIPAEGTSGTIAQVDLPSHLIVSPLDTTDGVLQAIQPSTPRTESLLNQTAPAPERDRTASSPALPVVRGGPPPGRPGTPVPQPSVPAPTMSDLPTRPIEQPSGQPRSLRAPEPALPPGDSPIFDAVQSAWFKRGGSSHWSSPADEGWRRAAEALRTAQNATVQPGGGPTTAGETGAGSARRAPAGPPGRTGPAPWHAGSTAGQPAPNQPTPSEPAAQPVRAGGTHAAPWRQQPVSSGLPVRQRGATLVPGSIPGAEEAERGPAGRADASNVASTLSNLQRGVSRGREESGGWVPKRPSDSERSNS